MQKFPLGKYLAVNASPLLSHPRITCNLPYYPNRFSCMTVLIETFHLNAAYWSLLHYKVGCPPYGASSISGFCGHGSPPHFVGCIVSSQSLSWVSISPYYGLQWSHCRPCFRTYHVNVVYSSTATHRYWILVLSQWDRNCHWRTYWLWNRECTFSIISLFSTSVLDLVQDQRRLVVLEIWIFGKRITGGLQLSLLLRLVCHTRLSVPYVVAGRLFCGS